MADAEGLNPSSRKGVWVQIPPPAPMHISLRLYVFAFPGSVRIRAEATLVCKRRGRYDKPAYLDRPTTPAAMPWLLRPWPSSSLRFPLQAERPAQEDQTNGLHAQSRCRRSGVSTRFRPGSP